MKRLYALLIVALFATAPSLLAQSNPIQDAAREAEALLRDMPTNNYRTIYAGYNSAHVNWREYGLMGEILFPINGGVTLGYLEALNIWKGMPIYVEYGANVQYLFGSEKLEGVEIMGVVWDTNYKTNLFAVNVPVNLSLRLSLEDGLIAVTPYAGLNARLHVAGKQVITSGKAKHETAVFDSSKEEGAAGDEAFNRFQLGFNVGCSVTYSVYSVGIGHIFDFSKLSTEGRGRLGVTTISLGYNF